MNTCQLSVDVREFFKTVAHAKPVEAEMVFPQEVAAPKAYRRFAATNEKAAFRDRLTVRLHRAWKTHFGTNQLQALLQAFRRLDQQLESDGAVTFGDLVSRTTFSSFVANYDRVMAHDGSVSFLHAYLDVRRHPELLIGEVAREVTLNPLLIALIAHRIGSPIRLVDGRAKDAQPISVLAQDNMLHIDNTPFNDEYKIIITWEKGKASGPKGQNFVFLPGTHKAARNCFVRSDGVAWSSENASIFVTDDSIDRVFAFQRRVIATAPAVVEIQDRERPLTTVFAAGSLVHHRFRTAAGNPRSCIIMAFHPAQYSNGSFMSCGGSEGATTLSDLMLSPQNICEERFLKALELSAEDIGKKLLELSSDNGVTTVLNYEARLLVGRDFEMWKQQATQAPRVEELKCRACGALVRHRDHLTVFNAAEMMRWDKHGPLDLILYDDCHEEHRKWARNRIREMPVDELFSRLADWSASLVNLTRADIIPPRDLAELMLGLRHSRSYATAELLIDRFQRYSLTSLLQLADDLAEAVLRCESAQAYVSTCLFMFWVVDELWRLNCKGGTNLRSLATRLLRNYLAVGVLHFELLNTHADSRNG